MFNFLKKFILILKKIFRIHSESKFESESENNKNGNKGEESIEEINGSDIQEEPTDTIPTEGNPNGPSINQGETTISKPPSENNKSKGGNYPDKEEEDDPRQRNIIYLGGKKRPRRNRKIKTTPTSINNGTNAESKSIGTSIKVFSPNVEINLEKAKVFLIIPKQQFETSKLNNIPQQLNYKLKLYEKEEHVPVNVNNYRDSIAVAEEKRIELPQSLKNFEIVYPDELQGNKYFYQHKDETMYIFIAIGNDLGRMHYLYDRDGNFNPLPKRDVWILLNFCLYELKEPEPKIIDERRIWNEYQLYCVDLKNTNELIIGHKQTGEEIKVSCEPSFSIEGDGLVEDDFKAQMPLFTGNSITIKAPTYNPSGWIIWIQNKHAGHKIVNENWTGDKPLELSLPDVLPCECGEFQVDIYEQDDRIPIETLFFRYIPHLKLEFPRNLIIPDPNTGHREEIIKILLERGSQDWEIKLNQETQHGRNINGYQVTLLPEQNILCFSLIKEGKLETETNFRITLPRLKWRTSKNETWYDKPIQIMRHELTAGKDFYLTVCSNDFDSKYKISTILEINEQRLQEANLVRKGLHYVVRLNQFYDTIKQSKGKLTIKLEIRNPNDNRLLGIREILQFMEIIQEPLRPESVSYDLINILSLPKICSILRVIKIKCPKEKSICKGVLQFYNQKIRVVKRAKRFISRDKTDFIIKALALVKFIMDYYGKYAPFKRQNKWRKRINFLQERYPEEFNNAYDKFSRR